MRILHTADWHIGQLFHEYERSYEHQRFLNWLVVTLFSENVDFMLINGNNIPTERKHASEQHQQNDVWKTPLEEFIALSDTVSLECERYLPLLMILQLIISSQSSSRMKVESLFIDEGFDSLEPTTLNIAMDDPKRLHNESRSVGVISHVQEITERIPVQIKVSKQQSGRSKVEVIGM